MQMRFKDISELSFTSHTHIRCSELQKEGLPQPLPRPKLTGGDSWMYLSVIAKPVTSLLMLSHRVMGSLQVGQCRKLLQPASGHLETAMLDRKGQAWRYLGTCCDHAPRATARWRHAHKGTLVCPPAFPRNKPPIHGGSQRSGHLLSP